MSTDINISNYEDYLYSYVDGELQAEEISALESFLEMHPQFRADLDLLMSTRLQPEAMVFNNKASLYRGSEITLQTYESLLLNYIDGELNQEEKAAFEQFVALHPAVGKELQTWQATKLQADTTVRFENKSVLYRKTSRRIEIRPAYWWAAAAVVAGALFFLKLSDSTEPADQGLVVADKQTTTPAAPVEKMPATTAPATAPQTQETTAVAAASVPKPVKEVKATQQPAETLVAKAANTAQTTANTASTKIELSDVARVEQQSNNKVIAAEISQQLRQIPGNEVAVNNRPSIEVGTSTSLATPAPVAEPELIMSVTGNGLESKVLDKVTNVARFFAKKKNK